MYEAVQYACELSRMTFGSYTQKCLLTRAQQCVHVIQTHVLDGMSLGI